MIQIKDKVNCSGCSACYNICPQKAIEMHEDEEGFAYPKIDANKCINCNLCEKVCPILNKIDNNKLDNETETLAYIAYNKDKNVRDTSAAGGIFSALAEKIIDLKGVVFGASFNDKFEVIHTYTENKEDLKKFRGSKYVQSVIGDSYRIVKEFLKKDRYVLFSGTTCQVEGLKKYLGKEYERLYLVDLVCHGVPSPKVIRKYKEYQQKKYKSKITYMSYREKTFGATSTTLSLQFENGKRYSRGHESDFILGAFLKGIISRPSCYNCKFKTIHRISDITLGDIWHINQLDNEFHSENGNTALLVHTTKGKKLLLSTNLLYVKEENLNDVLTLNANGKPSMVTESAKLPKEREEFFAELDKNDFSKIVKKYYPQNIKASIKLAFKKILFRLGILEKLKKFKG